jgi:hypothetical protein
MSYCKVSLRRAKINMSEILQLLVLILSKWFIKYKIQSQN